MATINGSAGNDSKSGTAGNDVLKLLNGNDKGYGANGNDTLWRALRGCGQKGGKE